MADRKQQETPPMGLVSWALYDWANNGFATLIQTFIFAAYFTSSVAADEAAGTAQWGNMLGVAGIVVGAVGPFLGAVADKTGRRKPWLAFFTALCVSATALLWFVAPDPSWALPALLLVGVGTVGSECSMVFYNAMLPDLVPRSRVGRWSGWGWGLGYVGGLLGLALCLFGFINEGAWFGVSHGAARHVRATSLLSAAWYAVFALPLLLFTPDVPATGTAFRAAVRGGWRQLVESIRHARQHKFIWRFLIARMIYNDALATMFAFGGIYAAGAFGMSPREVLLFGIGMNVAAGLGAAGFAWIDDRVGARPTILVSLVGLIIPGAAILLAKTKTVFWIFGLLLGVFVGPVQASSRSYLARVAPEELRTQMFGLFALSGKLTSFFGPLLVAWATMLSGSQRMGMSTIIATFVVGFILMLLVPPAEDVLRNRSGRRP